MSGGTGAGGFDPPLVRGRDGDYYFVIAGYDEDGKVHTFYIPAPLTHREMTYLDEMGKYHKLYVEDGDLADRRAVEGRFVVFKTFDHALGMEGSYRGSTVYIPVTGRWFPKENDPDGRYEFGIKAAADVPDSRAVEYWALGNFLRYGQTYHYLTRSDAKIPDVTPPVLHEAIVLGQNLNTGNTLLYDVYERENYNVAIFGQAGSGKSTLIKAWVSRLAEADPDTYIWIFDSIVSPEYALGPAGKYEGSFAELIGARTLDLSEPQGLNPFGVFETPAAATSFIADLAGIAEPDLRAELNLIPARDVPELVSKTDGPLRKRLEAGLKPFENLWAARSDLYNRQVFILSNIASSAVRDAAAYMILAWIWGSVKKLPVRDHKIIAVDEGWAFVETDPRTGKPYFPGAVELVSEIARTGRQYNAAFMIATQRVSDMMSGPGRVVMESAATKIVLRQDSTALDLLSGPLSLSPEEQRFVLSAQVGQGLLISPMGHVPFYNQLLRSELERFLGKPK